MSTRVCNAQVSLLDDRIEILDKDASGSSPAKRVFRTVAAILAFVRDKTIANKESVQLSDYCFNACEALKAKIEGGDADLDEYLRVALEDLGRVTLQIERTLRRGASTPQVKYDKKKVKKYESEIRDILDNLDKLSPTFNGDGGVCGRTNQSLSVDSAAATSASEPGALERLIRRKFVPQELPSLIEEILVCKDVVDTIRYLPRDDAQTFIDVVNEALDMPDLSPWAQKQCLRPLYRTCGRHALLPKVMEIPTCYDRTGDALYSGGYADVWKGQYLGRDVAVKVIRTFSNSDLGKVIGRFCKEAITWKTLRHPNVLPLIGVTMTETKFAMISEWMVNGNLNEFVSANPDADRLKLLEGAAKGLIYIHGQGAVHGDLKGANILIDETCHARLADFGLLTAVSDPANILPSSSFAPGGTARWMSPECISPEDFGCKTSRPSKSSDCYSLGMVIYETICGNVPFHEDKDITVFVKVLKGERPRREVGFGNNLWNMLERCWKSQPSDRPSIEDVLRCLEICPNGMSGQMKSDLSFDDRRSPPGEQAFSTPPFERLIRREFVPHELPSLIEETLVRKDLDEAIRCLLRDDAQTLIDVMDKAPDMPDLTPQARNQCLGLLYRMCGRRALLPNTMKIPSCYDRTSSPLHYSACGAMWKGQYRGRDVAVKVVRAFTNSDLGKVTGRFCKEAILWKTLRHPNVLQLIGVTMTETEFATISEWMPNGNLIEFVKANPDADRLKLLEGATRGLIYIHEHGRVHGDLKGANVLIDQTGHARLAGFDQLTVTSGPANLSSSSSYWQADPARWTSPERILPQDFGLNTGRPSKSSDCYSLGMVIYETISGNLPFHGHPNIIVLTKVLGGERPRREVGFANSLWNMLERCWMPRPSDRPSIEDVLRCLEICSDRSAEGAKGGLSFDGLG